MGTGKEELEVPGEELSADARSTDADRSPDLAARFENRLEMTVPHRDDHEGLEPHLEIQARLGDEEKRLLTDFKL